MLFKDIIPIVLIDKIVLRIVEIFFLLSPGSMKNIRNNCMSRRRFTGSVELKIGSPSQLFFILYYSNTEAVYFRGLIM